MNQPFALSMLLPLDSKQKKAHTITTIIKEVVKIIIGVKECKKLDAVSL